MTRTTASLRSIALAVLGCTLVTARASAEPEPEKTIGEAREAAREKVREAREAIHEARDKAKTAIKEAKRTAQEKAGEVEAETGSAIEDAKDKTKAAVAEAKQAVQEAKVKASEAVQSAKQDVDETKREVLEGAHEKLREAMGPDAHDRAERARAARRTAWIGLRSRWRAPSELPQEMRIELRKHAVRMAKLSRIRSLASEKDDKAAVERTDKLLTAERARHRAVMAKIMKARPPLAARQAAPEEEEEDEEVPPEEAEEDEEQAP